MKFQTTHELRQAVHYLDAAAGARYERMAEEMERLGKTEVVETFQALAAGKRLGLREDAGAPDAGREAKLRTYLASLMDDDNSMDERYAMTPQQALNLAIRSETQDLTAYTHIAGHAENAAVIEMAEQLASKALDQLRQLRLARRRADRTRTMSAYRKQIIALTREADNPGQAETALQAIIAVLARRLEIVSEISRKISPDDSKLIFQAAAMTSRIITKPDGPMESFHTTEDDPFVEPPITRAIADVEIAFDGLLSAATEVRDEICLRQALDFAAALIPILHLLRRE